MYLTTFLPLYSDTGSGGIFFTSQIGMLDHASIYLYIQIDQIDRPIDSHLDIFLQIVMVSTHMDMTMFYLGE